MSSIPHDHAAGHGHAHEHHPGGIMRWVMTTNHKDIGTLYLWFSFIMFIAGGIMALTIRAAPLAAPGAGQPQTLASGRKHPPDLIDTAPAIHFPSCAALIYGAGPFATPRCNSPSPNR